MGQMDDAQLGKKKGNSRGKTNNNSRLAGLGKAHKPEGGADWADVDPNGIAALVILLSNASGAIRFGKSRDGNVLSIGIYLDDDSVTLWLDGDGTIEQQLYAIYENIRNRIGA